MPSNVDITKAPMKSLHFAALCVAGLAALVAALTAVGSCIQEHEETVAQCGVWQDQFDHCREFRYMCQSYVPPLRSGETDTCVTDVLTRRPKGCRIPHSRFDECE